MALVIKHSATEHSIAIDGTKFDVPNIREQRDGLRELVVNYWCRKHGYAPLYPDAPKSN